MPNILSDKDFRERVLEGESVEGVSLRKQFTAEEIKAVGDDKSRVLKFVISTETVDRMGDIIKATGWELDPFKKNPVVLFAHDSRRPPIGRALDVEVKGKKLRATAEFMDDEVDRSGFSDTIFRMLKAGFLRATSVGFLPKEWEYIKEEDDEGHSFITGFKFTKQELLEFSVVPIPANPDALISARSAGIDMRPLEAWYEEALDKWVEYRKKLLVPKKDVIDFYRSVRRSTPVAIPAQEDTDATTEEMEDMAEEKDREDIETKDTVAEKKEQKSPAPEPEQKDGPDEEEKDVDLDHVDEIDEDEDFELEIDDEEVEERSTSEYSFEIRVGDVFISCKMDSMESINSFIEKHFGNLGELVAKKLDKPEPSVTEAADSADEQEVENQETKRDQDLGDEDLLEGIDEDELQELVKEAVGDVIAELRGKVK